MRVARRIALALALIASMVLVPSHAWGLVFDGPDQHTVGSFPRHVLVVDLDRDGDQDVVTTNYFAQSLTVLLGDGAGGFTEAGDSPIVLGGFDAPNEAAAGDVDGDGDLDLLVATRLNVTPHKVRIFLQGGGGNFTPGTAVDTNSNPESLAVGDINRDGIPDIVIAAQLSNAVDIRVGVGDGTFVSSSTIGVGWSPRNIVLLDLNGDGKLDFVTANTGQTSPTLIAASLTMGIGQGDGSFSVTTSQLGSSTSSPSDAAVGDINRDGYPDVVFSLPGDESIQVLYGAPVTPATQQAIATGGNPDSVAVADVDLDGKQDVIVGDGDADPYALRFFRGNGAGDLTQPVDGSFLILGTPNDVAVGDFNRDGDPDLAAVTSPDEGDNVLEVRLNATNIDRDPPETIILEHPPALTNDDTPALSFRSDSDGSTFRCTLDEDPEAVCTNASPLGGLFLSDGEHTFSVAAVDQAGNKDQSPDSVTFTVDATGPVVTITGPAKTTKRVIAFALSFSEDVTEVECRIDLTTPVACTNPFVTPKLAYGKHTLTVFATDRAGNPGPLTPPFSFKVIH